MKALQAAEALRLVREAALAAREAGELGEFLGELERIRVEALIAPATPPAAASPEKPEQHDRLLTTKEVHERTGMSCWWIRQNKATLPIVRLQTGGYRFSERGLERWIQSRSGAS